ncbi:hypothetical protein H2204_010377 [Knufia peltigerae]|uniref:Uncharacterized protein n=1 Tax=Knufia peltigerae TaxID=1002370 RepID=A0AA38XW98_9EURO|nr:hypothetical protein H2204_010377 [Knufia peltigerae]
MFLSSDPAIPQSASNHSPYQDRTEDDSEVEEARNPGFDHLPPYSRETAMPSHWLEEHPPSQTNEAPHQYRDNSQLPLTRRLSDAQYGVQTSLHSRWAEEQDMSSQTAWESQPISRSPSDYSPASVGYRPTMPHHPPSNLEYRITSPIYCPPDMPTRSSSSHFNGAMSRREPSSYHPSLSALLKELKPVYPVEFPVSSHPSDVLDPSSAYRTSSQYHINSRPSERMEPYQTLTYDHAGSGGIGSYQRTYDNLRASDSRLPVSPISDLGLQQTSSDLYGAEYSRHEPQAEAGRHTRPSDLDSLFDGSSGVEDEIKISEQPTASTDDPMPSQKSLSASGLSRNFDPQESKPSLENQDGAGVGLHCQQREDLNLIPGLSGNAVEDDVPCSVISHRLGNDTHTDSGPLQNAADRLKNMLAANGIKREFVPEKLAKVLESPTAEHLAKGTQLGGHQGQLNGDLHQELMGSTAAQPGQSRGGINTTSGNQNSCLTPSRPDTPRPLPDQSIWRYGTELMTDHVRQSVEPEIPVTNWIRESTPAYEDRSNTPSPCSRSDRDVEMQNAPGYQIPSPPPEATSSPLKSHEPTIIRPESPKKLAAPPVPDDIPTLKQPKRGERRKSGIQGGKVEKRSVTGSKAKGVPKSRNLTCKPTTSMGKLIEQAKKASSANDQQEALKPKSVGNVAAAVQKIEQELQKQKDGNPLLPQGFE